MRLIWLLVMVLMFASAWKIFVKAGREGWEGIVPFYNLYVMLQIVGKPGWWLILLFIPFVNFVIGILVAIALAQRFGKPGGFAVGLILLPVVFYPILAFSDARYQAPLAQTPPSNL